MSTNSTTEPDDETVVQAASDAAEDVIFSRYKQSAVRDYDVTVTFEEGVLEVDVYLNVPGSQRDESDPGPERVADDAALAARAAVDDLFGE
ncbi:DUF3194 domain-containing protein [Natrialbaceae archaeon GCM10025810]|uniref:DUF3194 domain-containing protein n=1 Tax=Halovalidus salilacus TaxID=3075124 RepID=UPI00360E8EE4